MLLKSDPLFFSLSFRFSPWTALDVQIPNWVVHLFHFISFFLLFGFSNGLSSFCFFWARHIGILRYGELVEDLVLSIASFHFPWFFDTLICSCLRISRGEQGRAMESGLGMKE